VDIQDEIGKVIGKVMALLEIRKVNKQFGGLAALNKVDLDVFDSEILGLIGPNGAGKTTLFNIVSGFFPATGGSVTFKGKDITDLRADQIAQAGIARTFQQTNLFMQATVFDNVFTGFYMHYRQPGWKAFLHTRSVKNEEVAIKEKVRELLEMMGLVSMKDELAVNLPHGHQRILGVCIALGCNPKLLLLDEPMTGMNPTETQVMVDLIKKIRDKGVTIVLVEHDMKAVMSLCERIVALNYGKIIAEGLPEDITVNSEVIEAYLGKKEE
jgi:branched-chain amino acid transport system ATP-binding protein